MLFSTIDEAWHTPVKVENFKTSIDYDCDALITKLLSCKECYNKLMNKVDNTSNEYQLIQNIYKKYILSMPKKTREKLINFLTIIAVVLFIMIIQN